MRRVPFFFRAGLVLLIVLVVSGSTLADDTPVVFGIKPGMLIQSSFIGLSYPRVEPYVGLDWIVLDVNAEGGDAYGSVIIPHLGAKYFLKPQRSQGHVAPYLLGDYFFSLSAVDVDNYTKEEEELAQQILSFWGINLGFGAEYYFSDFFSVGGEYGIRFLHDSVDKHERTTDSYWGPRVETVNEEFSFAFRVTYAAISLNFRF